MAWTCHVHVVLWLRFCVCLKQVGSFTANQSFLLADTRKTSKAVGARSEEAKNGMTEHSGRPRWGKGHCMAAQIDLWLCH